MFFYLKPLCHTICRVLHMVAKVVAPAMWQAVCAASTDGFTCDTFDPLVFKTFKSPAPDSPIKLVDQLYLSYKGKLGSKLPFNDVIPHLDDCDVLGIGSVRFKCVYNGVNVSVIVFNTGSIKLSGGSPKFIIDDDGMNSFLTLLFNDLCWWLSICPKVQPVISCLNGNIKLPMFSGDSLKLLVNSRRSVFARVVNPNLQLKGRRCAYKLYPLHNSNLHIAIDYSGSAQIFAAKSVSQLRLPLSLLFS